MGFKVDTDKLTNNIKEVLSESDKKSLSIAEIIRILHKKYIYHNQPYVKKHMDKLVSENILSEITNQDNNRKVYKLYE